MSDDPCLEIERFARQCHQLENEILEAIDRLESESLRSEAEIMRTHLMLLQDPELQHQVHELIRDTRQRAETAVESVLEGMASMLATAQDPLLAERAADLRDLSGRLQTGLGEANTEGMEGWREATHGTLVALPELLPSLVLEARELGILGFVVENGTAFSHAAILAKSFAIPVVRVAPLQSITGHAERIVLITGKGEILVEPDALELTKLASRWPAQEAIPTVPVAGAPRLRLWLSIVDPEQLNGLDWSRIEGIGLYRSEALFMRHCQNFPSEQEQYAEYRRLFKQAGRRPVVFRTLDLGADKPVEHMHFGPQLNPCLGMRAHRLYYFHPEVLRIQIRAVLRAAYGNHELRLLYPMLESIDQLHFVQRLVEEAVQSLERDGTPFQHRFQQGVLVEIPSAVWSFDRLLSEVDFASIGTNDLVQYLFAVERNAANVAALYQPEHPIVLQIIRQLVRQAAAAGKPLTICGEMAADLTMLPLLAGLGLRDLSLAPNAVVPVLHALSGLDEAACNALAERCLETATSSEIRELVGSQSQPRQDRQAIGAGEAIDPVCGMIVHAGHTPYRLTRDETTYYFCSRSCLERFVAQAGGG
jgi:phosphoenolpyruvate-protein phosphotransferase